MNLDKLNRSISLLCPTCGSSEMESLNGPHDISELFKCNSCGLEITKDELMSANQENINTNLDEMKQEAVKDVKSEIEKVLKNTFKDSKNITFK